jgi:solute carrier family 25 phosphate transporter 3
VLSGLPHFILTPFDQIKCRMQTGEFATALDGFKHIWFDPAHRGQLSLRVTAMYRGWVPTLIGYSLQGATKFGLYEYLKWSLKASLGPDFAREHQVLLFLASSALAEFCADVLLAPWEAIKVKVQTNVAAFSGNAALTSHLVPRMYATEGLFGFFKGLPPLWMRQVPYTMAKFATFETTVDFFYRYVLGASKAQTGPFAQLLVSLVSGFIAGFFCTMVSHPADTVVSKLNQKNDGRVGAWQVVQDLGCAGLWKGLLARIMFVGTLTAMQWLIYDSFKVLVGLQTTGGNVNAPSSSSIHHHGVNPPPMALTPGAVDVVHGAEHHIRHFQKQHGN